VLAMSGSLAFDVIWTKPLVLPFFLFLAAGQASFAGAIRRGCSASAL
jgi:hypothetical protein